MKEEENKILEKLIELKKVERYRDCVIMMGFIILSIAFNKWWISLLAVAVIILVKATDTINDNVEEESKNERNIHKN